MPDTPGVAGAGGLVGGGVDPRPEFAERLRALKDAAGLSDRRLEAASGRTPRRRAGQPPLRLKRSTIAGMISRTRPVRPEPEHVEVFVDTCIRVAGESDRPVSGDLGDRHAWDAAYRDLLLRMAGVRSANRSATEATKQLQRMEPRAGEADNHADSDSDSDSDGGAAEPAQPCPYRGLAAFGPDDARLFFGRAQLTADLLDRVAEKWACPGPLMVTGPSGSGKSSLLRAGLIAALDGNGPPAPGRHSLRGFQSRRGSGGRAG